jgi:hypothetical protein
MVDFLPVQSKQTNKKSPTEIFDGGFLFDLGSHHGQWLTLTPAVIPTIR